MLRPSERLGESFVLLNALTHGFLPVLIALSFASLSLMQSFIYSCIFGLLVVLPFTLGQGQWRRACNAKALRYCLLTSLLMTVFYVLFFAALVFTTPNRVAMLMLTELVTTAIIFRIWFNERLTPIQWVGAGCVMLGVILILGFDSVPVGLGDLLILIVVLVAPFANFFQKRAIQHVRADVLVVFRFVPVALLGSVWLIYQGEATLWLAPSFPWWLIVYNGAIALGIAKMFWAYALTMMPVPKAIALVYISPLVTLLASWWLLSTPPTWVQGVAIVPLLMGAWILVLTPKLNKQSAS